jgi:hypothetical protein
MGKGALAVLLAVVLAGCTRVVAPPPATVLPVAPIAAGQVRDLLSPNVGASDGNLFVTVEPENCTGVAREVDPPFIFDHDPAAHDGGHWAVEGQEVVVEEMVGVYHASFDPKDALAEAKRTIESCRGVPFTVTTMRGREHTFELAPQVDFGSPDILLWSFSAVDWACDSAFVAAHNAAIEISTCGPVNGYDVLSLAREALDRIEALANTTA